MPKAHFVFTQLSNSFRVHIPNLEELDISDIQAIEDFVAKRKGYFDFNTYSFVLQKRLDYEEFVKLISAQRAYQANSRIITTSDQLLVEVVNLKR